MKKIEQQIGEASETKLSPEQVAQTSRQIEAYEHRVGVGLQKISLGDSSFELQVNEYVANPEIMNSGVQVVKFLGDNPELVRGKTVTDMGTGSGIIGVASSLLGAKKVFMPDIEQRAVDNAGANINRLGLAKGCEAFQSDLFSNYGDRPKSDVQIFNHPFFVEVPVDGKPWTNMMFGGAELLGKYFQEAPKCSTEDAIYILPWFTSADNANGIDNDPGKRAAEHGFEIVSVTEQEPVKQGIQRAMFKIYLLRKKKQ